MDGLGLSFGPILSSGLYELLGFRFTNLAFTALIVLLGVVPTIFLPARGIDSSVVVEDAIDCTKISYKEILTNFRSVNALIGRFLANVFLSYVEPSLALQLESMGQSTGAIGLIFAL
jgi:hypothetical protein